MTREWLPMRGCASGGEIHHPESPSNQIDALLVLVGPKYCPTRIGIDGVVGRRITIVARQDMCMQVRHSVAEHGEVHLERAEYLVERTTNSHHVVKKERAIRVSEVIRLTHVPPAE